MNFKSQICTSREQSERLLSLGLKKETADMKYVGLCRNEDGSMFFQKIPICKGVITENNIDLPAWSLHRLIEMMPTLIGWRDKQYWLDVNNDGVCYSTSMSYALVEFIADNLYDNIIFCIEWLINVGYFNKEYLEE